MLSNRYGHLNQIARGILRTTTPSTLIIPSTGLEEFQRVLTEMVKTEKALPAKQSAPPEPGDSIGNR